jgi:hypothetical protein
MAFELRLCVVLLVLALPVLALLHGPARGGEDGAREGPRLEERQCRTGPPLGWRPGWCSRGAGGDLGVALDRP